MSVALEELDLRTAFRSLPTGVDSAVHPLARELPADVLGALQWMLMPRREDRPASYELLEQALKTA